jgi:hypothetical protein
MSNRPNYSPDQPTPLWISREADELLLEAHAIATEENRTVAIQVIVSDIRAALAKRDALLDGPHHHQGSRSCDERCTMSSVRAKVPPSSPARHRRSRPDRTRKSLTAGYWVPN